MKQGTLTMDNGVSPGEVGGVFAGVVALGAALGKAAKWLLNWQEAREKSNAARLRAWEKSLDRREREQRAETERRFHAMEEKVGMMASALFEAIAELQVLDPRSVALARAKIVLRKAFPVDEETPGNIEALVGRLDQQGEKE